MGMWRDTKVHSTASVLGFAGGHRDEVPAAPRRRRQTASTGAQPYLRGRRRGPRAYPRMRMRDAWFVV